MDDVGRRWNNAAAASSRRARLRMWGMLCGGAGGAGAVCTRERFERFFAPLLTPEAAGGDAAAMIVESLAHVELGSAEENFAAVKKSWRSVAAFVAAGHGAAAPPAAATGGEDAVSIEVDLAVRDGDIELPTTTR